MGVIQVGLSICMMPMKNSGSAPRMFPDRRPSAVSTRTSRRISSRWRMNSASV
jgi:hypothetical protein